MAVTCKALSSLQALVRRTAREREQDELTVLFRAVGFWITFVTLILVIAAGVLMFVKRRRQVLADAGYPMLSSQQKGTRGFLSLFRKS